MDFDSKINLKKRIDEVLIESVKRPPLYRIKAIDLIIMPLSILLIYPLYLFKKVFIAIHTAIGHHQQIGEKKHEGSHQEQLKNYKTETGDVTMTISCVRSEEFMVKRKKLILSCCSIFVRKENQTPTVLTLFRDEEEAFVYYAYFFNVFDYLIGLVLTMSYPAYILINGKEII